MKTKVMEYPIFSVSGKVINSMTKKGVYNLRVEAWDKDEKYNDLLGISQTDVDGLFQITFDLSYFREYAPDTAPDLFFKVFRGKELLRSTEDSVIWNASIQTEVEIVVDLPAERPEGTDYISSQHIFNFLNFFSDSDFKGFQKQSKEKVSQNFSFAKDIVKNAIFKMNMDPIRVSGPKIDEVVGQNVDVAKRNLALKQIEVNEEREYNPGMNRESIKEISSLPLDLKAGQKVNLYKENGKVKYYSLVSEEKQANIEIRGKIDLQQKEIFNLREELKLAKEREKEKDTQIAKLKESTEILKADQLKIWDKINISVIRNSPNKKPATTSEKSKRKPGVK